MLVKEPSFVMIDGRRIAYDEVSPPHPQGTVLLLTFLRTAVRYFPSLVALWPH